MIRPQDIYISEDEFNSLVVNAETAYMEERNKTPLTEREPFVKFWVKVCSQLVPKQFLLTLDERYRENGWKRVRVEFVNDRTESLMIYLANE